MHKCCIVDCDTHNLKNTDHIAYFKFPLHDDKLLAKWLRKIPRQPEGWRPNDKTFICSWHFRSKDIDKNPKRDFLLLRANAAPTIFKKITPNHHPWPVIIQDQVKKNVNVPRKVTTTTTTTTPVILSDLLGSGEATEDMKYRKILPRANTVTQILVPTESISTPPRPMASSGNHSYFLLVPTHCENPQVDVSGGGEKAAVLTVQVERKMSDDPLMEEEEISGDDKDPLAVSDNIVAAVGGDVENEAKDDAQELVIYSRKYKQFIVFTLDHETNEIRVSRRNTGKRDAADDDSVVADEPATKVVKILDNEAAAAAASLKDQYCKARQECTKLQSQLVHLRKQCLVETETIAHLEKELREPKNESKPITDTIDEDLERMMADSPEKTI